jgi:hypothetical protein
MPVDPVFVIIGIIVLLVAIWAFARYAKIAAERERQRLAALAQWASMNGFQFNPQDPWNLDGRYSGLFDIGKGHARWAFETLTRTSPVPAAIFQYHFRTWETRTVTRNGRTRVEQYEETHWRRYLILELGVEFPRLFLRTEGMFDKIAGFIGFDDIDFESEEFSKRYFCKSDDRQFAYAVIHPQMMEWLMGRRYEAELHQGLLLMDLSGRDHTAEGCQEAWGNAVGFVNRIPPFVWKDYAHREPMKLPEPVAFVPPASHGISPAAAAYR